MNFGEPSDTKRHRTKELTNLPACSPFPIRPTLWILPQRKGSKVLGRTTQFTCWGITVSARLAGSLATAIQVLRCPDRVSKIHLEPIATVLRLQTYFCLQQAGCVPRSRETTDCYRYYGSCCTADISRDGNSYVPAKPQLNTWTPHHRDSGRWVSALAYFHFRSGQ